MRQKYLKLKLQNAFVTALLSNTIEDRSQIKRRQSRVQIRRPAVEKFISSVIESVASSLEY